MSNIDRRSTTRLELLRLLPAIAIAVAAGCAKPEVAPAPRTAPPPAPKAPRAEAPAAPKEAAPGDQLEAQKAWCSYLDALFQRATKDGSTWPHREQCLSEKSNASPAMLAQTAKCSHAALDKFEGDPLTPEYAQLVRHCGVEALDASALGPEALEPFVDAICRRNEACGGGPLAACRAEMAPHIASRLGRAIGAINLESRDRLRTCLNVASCDLDMSDRLSGCIEPIMDKLLWLPPEKDE
jgi:hypothetical protein